MHSTKEYTLLEHCRRQSLTVFDVGNFEALKTKYLPFMFHVCKVG